MRKSLLAAAMVLTLSAPAANAANIVETAKEAGVFGTLLAAAKAAGLADALATGENLSVFAPTDDAFAKLPAGTVEDLLKPENKDKLAAILSYHVLPRELVSNQLPAGPIHVRTIKSGGDRTLAVAKSGAVVTVDDATVVQADIKADNGVIHVIDTVMLPSS
ncbi:uncharacterized surface protein with fasciclin (FAS1) repeats [Hoeflea halophila]|uniref:Uncharacterized surface protein with fasciclin (FAS1) repeats n=1 Tax=Hoeflea halophila TaxID=714899 RepID=A0A286IEF3_9HYPH|nr:fasciclin domain-containing protein [Hoeflea halophila]SOE17709.1 uncharacterized surface protein with fasciclin (FAS1) repeats [Hoeflea halophila]